MITVVALIFFAFVVAMSVYRLYQLTRASKEPGWLISRSLASVPQAVASVLPLRVLAWCTGPSWGPG